MFDTDELKQIYYGLEYVMKDIQANAEDVDSVFGVGYSEAAKAKVRKLMDKTMNEFDLREYGAC